MPISNSQFRSGLSDRRMALFFKNRDVCACFNRTTELTILVKKRYSLMFSKRESLFCFYELLWMYI